MRFKHKQLPDNFEIRISVTGYYSTGNTSLIKTFVNKNFDDTHPSTIGFDGNKTTLNTKHGEVNLLIYDTKVSSYEEKIHRINCHFMIEKSHAVISTIPAYEELDLDRFQFFIDQVESFRNGKPVFLVALRCDLEWKLDDKKIDEIVTKYNYKFFKTSAKTHENVDLVFEQITEDVILKCLEGFYDNDQNLNPYKDLNTQVVNRDKKCLIY